MGCRDQPVSWSFYYSSVSIILKKKALFVILNVQPFEVSVCLKCKFVKSVNENLRKTQK